MIKFENFPDSLKHDSILEFIDFINKMEPLNKDIKTLFENYGIICDSFYSKQSTQNNQLKLFGKTFDFPTFDLPNQSNITITYLEENNPSLIGFRDSELTLNMPFFDNTLNAFELYLHEFAHSIDYLLGYNKTYFTNKYEDKISTFRKFSTIPYNIKTYIETVINADKTLENYQKYYNHLITADEAYKYSAVLHTLTYLSDGKVVNYTDPNPPANCEKIEPPLGINDYECIKEIFADYIAMNYVSKDALLVLRRDFSELYKLMDKIVIELIQVLNL